MAKAKIAITLDRLLLAELDSFVSADGAKNRSQLVERAVAEWVRRVRKVRLRKALEAIDPAAEKAAAEEWLAAEVPWPEY